MQLSTHKYAPDSGWDQQPDSSMDSRSTLVVMFGPSETAPIDSAIESITETFPNSVITGCSTAGEIFADDVTDKILSVAVLKFENTALKTISVPINSAEESYIAALDMVSRLDSEDLKAVFVLSDGLLVNGSQLTKGFHSLSQKGVVITGGLAGDGGRFEKTWVMAEGIPRSAYVTIVGFYGDSVRVSYGTKGGWDVMEADIEVTHAIGNVLYELDNQPALQYYKEHMGEDADGLPATGLLYPLALKNEDPEIEDLVRTILAVDEEEGSLTFAGNIPNGCHVRLMKANFDRLIDGAKSASSDAVSRLSSEQPYLCLSISCVGRRLVLQDRTSEELEAVLSILPAGSKQIGFYSYGEISPLSNGICDLHNQTMTLTLISEH